jgi:chromosomal replication initiation ATPase DnaA
MSELLEVLEIKMHSIISRSFKEMSEMAYPLPVVKRAACAACGIDTVKLETKTRHRETVYARMLIASYLRLNTATTLSAIGRTLGGKDHATILHYIRNLKNLYEVRDKKISELVHNFRVNLLNSSSELRSTKIICK